MKLMILTLLFAVFGVFLVAQTTNFYVTVTNTTDHNLSGRMNAYETGTNHVLANRIGTDTFHFWNHDQYGQHIFYCVLPIPAVGPNGMHDVDAISHDPETNRDSHWHGSSTDTFTNPDPNQFHLPNITLINDQAIPNPK